MEKLPQELIEEIIGSIDRTRPYGHSALLACSRVCRSWRRPAQKELFSRLSFTSIDHLRVWDCRISPESEIPSYVRHLRWAIPSPRALERGDPFFEVMFPSLFASFSGIERLHIPNLSLRLFDATAIERSLNHLRHSLQHLTISHLRTTLEQWCFFVSLLPCLRRIDISSVTVLGGDPGSNHHRSFDFTGQISSYCDMTEQFFRFIASLNPRFESLGANMVNCSLVDTFNLVVRRCSPTLNTISITPIFSAWGTEGNLYSSRLCIANPIHPVARAISLLDLSPCSNLRILKIDRELASFPESEVLLQTISSSHFEKLVIGPSSDKTAEHLGTNDRAFRLFAERLYKLGAKKPVAMVLEFLPAEEGEGNADVQHFFPLFCEVGTIVMDYIGRQW